MSTAPNVYLITGNDGALISSAATKLVREVAGENPDPFAFDIVHERDGATTAEVLGELMNSLASPSFLGGQKTVWLQGFSAFDSEGAKTSKTAEAKAFVGLCEMIEAGLPSDVVLVMSGPGVDQRKRLFKACKEYGSTTVCNKPDVSSRNWQADMSRLVVDKSREKGMQLSREVLAYLVDVLGTDTLRIDAELEKLLCYCGGADLPVSLADAQEICVGNGEAMSWSLLDAMGHRNLEESLRLLDVLLRQEKDPEGAIIGLIIQVAGRFRQLLQLRIFMQERKLRSPSQVMGTADSLSKDEKNEIAAVGMDIISSHPYRLKMLAEQALKYSGQELVGALTMIRDANRACVGSSVSNRVVIERLLINLLS